MEIESQTNTRKGMTCMFELKREKTPTKQVVNEEEGIVIQQQFIFRMIRVTE